MEICMTGKMRFGVVQTTKDRILSVVEFTSSLLCAANR